MGPLIQWLMVSIFMGISLSDKYHSGSTPPMSYTYLGCQYILFTATGGKWYDNKGNGDKLLHTNSKVVKINISKFRYKF